MALSLGPGCINALQRNMIYRISCLFHRLPADVPGELLTAKGQNTTKRLNAVLFLN